MSGKFIGIALSIAVLLAGCGKQEAATPAISAEGSLGRVTTAESSVTVYQPKEEDQIIKIVRLEATGATETDACNEIISNATRAASSRGTGWGNVTVKGGGACPCEKREGYYACAREVYLGKLSTEA